MECIMATYVVKSGDTLSRIARDFGLTLAELLDINPQITDEDLIFVGQQIAVPDGGTPPVEGPTEALPLTVLSRADWGANPNLPRLGAKVQRDRRTKVYIHHTVITNPGPDPNVWNDLGEVRVAMRGLQRVRPDLGLDVPYSMVAFCMASGELVLAEGRGIDRVGAHTAGQNTPGIGIAFEGDFENHPAPPEIGAHLVTLGSWLHQLRADQGFVNLGSGHPTGRDVFGHRDVKSTDCPGKAIFSRLELVRFL
jgi:LysM repeat protein